MNSIAAVLTELPGLTGLPGLVQLPAVPGETISTGETVAFWVLGPLALAGGLGMVFARNAVHSALWLVLTMLSLGAMYVVQQAPFLGVVQIIVYTGAIMMLFLFVLMLVGRDSVDSLVEVLRGQRVAAAALGLGLAVVLAATLGTALQGVPSIGLAEVNAGGAHVLNLGRLLFTDYVFPFELTAALLIIATLAAVVLTFSEHAKELRMTQRQRAEVRVRGDRPSPLPGPGVFATAHSVATPALLPDGSVSEDSMFEIIESTARERLDEDLRSVASAGAGADPRALRGPVPPGQREPREPSEHSERPDGSSGSAPTEPGSAGAGEEAGR